MAEMPVVVCPLTTADGMPVPMVSSLPGSLTQSIGTLNARGGRG